MKKILIPLFTFLFLFFGSDIVFASSDMFDIEYDLSLGVLPDNSYSQMKTIFEANADIITDMFTYHYNNWLSNYSSEYPYYYVNFQISDSSSFSLEFVALSYIPTIPYNSSQYLLPYELYGSSLYFNNSITSYPLVENSDSFTFYSYSNNSGYIYANRYFYSNFNLYFTGFPSSISNIGYTTSGDTIITLDWLSDSHAPLKSLYNYYGLSFLNDYSPSDYTEVNLNNYAYIILSLKDYTNLISPVEFYVKGQLCPTPVYNYGMTAKNVTDRCSVVYDNFTPVRLYISSNDLSNHIVFYLSAYDLSISNIVKVDTNVFDISYITSDNASEPVVVVDGRPYSAIPLQDLKSSAIKNEENNFVPGLSCAIGDINCQAEASGMDISDLFTHPLELLQDMWSAITSVFSIITSFILLLPVPLQTFMYTAFMFAVILGLLKIIIG